MTSAPHLLNEDRPDFDRVLDEALHIVLDSDGNRADGDFDHPLNSEQLRTLALAAADSIGAAADEEYQAYRALRTRIREAARASARDRANRSFGYAAMGVADGARPGAGLVAVMAVLTPLLAASAAVIFLLIGYALRAVSPEPGIAGPLRTAGWFFAAVAAAAILIGVIGLVLTALRDGSSAIHDTPESMPDEVAQARQAWREALLARGLLPFLDDALSSAATAGAAAGVTTGGQGPAGAAGPGAAPSRMPRLGYSRPDFTSPQDGQATRPRFSSPDFTGPDYTGPDFTSPDYQGPEYGGPERRPE